MTQTATSIDATRHLSSSTFRPVRTALALFVTLTVLLGSQAVALAGQQNDGFVVRPDAHDRAVEVLPFATLYPVSGNELRFVELRGSDGQIQGVGIVEVVARGESRMAQIDLLSGANPMEVFNALSPRGTAIPAILEELYGPPTLGPQGWGEPQADVAGVVVDADVSFTPPVIYNSYPRNTGCLTRYGAYPAQFVAPLQHGLDNFSDFYLNSWNGPLSTPAEWHVSADPPKHQGSAPYHDFYGQANGATAFSAAIMLCDTAFFHKVDSVSQGKDIVLYTRDHSPSDSDPWLSIHNLGKLDAIDKVISFQYHPPEPVSPFAPVFDFRLEIQNASAATSQSGPGTKGDRYHIGATWHVNSSGDFPSDD